MSRRRTPVPATGTWAIPPSALRPPRPPQPRRRPPQLPRPQPQPPQSPQRRQHPPQLPNPQPPRPQPPPPRRRGAVVFVRMVCAENLVSELTAIRALLTRYPYVTVHAEYGGPGGYDDDGGRDALPPGVRVEDLSAAARYALAKIDVDAYPLLRLGVTLCDAHGRLPALRPRPGAAAADAESVWQVALLHPRSAAAAPGATPITFTALSYALRATGVVSAETRGTVTWVAHGGLYHLGYLLRALTAGAPLPNTREEFLAALRAYLGGKVFDVRYVAERLPGGLVALRGPLAHLAALLDAPAAAAREPWQAGEKSLVACQVFMRIKGLFFAWDGIDVHAGCIHGLHSTPPPPPLLG